MENTTIYEPVYEIYPGAYVPMLKEAEIRSSIKLSVEGESVLPLVNVLEFQGCFKIEMAIPGVKREDFLVHADGNALLICVSHKSPSRAEQENFQLHEFNYDCFARQVILPLNADLELANAEYKEGILRLYIAKTTLPVKQFKTEIPVY
jgi:HSP20 family protein